IPKTMHHNLRRCLPSRQIRSHRTRFCHTPQFGLVAQEAIKSSTYFSFRKVNRKRKARSHNELEIALTLRRFDNVAGVIVNADRRIMRVAVETLRRPPLREFSDTTTGQRAARRGLD